LGTPSDYDCGGEETTWLTRVLPFLEQQAAGQRWDHQMAYADHGDEVRTFSIPAYRCPSRRGSNQSVGEGVAAGSATSYITLPCGCRVPVTTPSTTPLIGAVGDYGGNHGDLSPGAFGLPTDFYYGGNGTGIIISSRAKCSPEDPSVPVRWIDKVTHASVRDGLSNTVLIGEMHVPMDRMGKSPGDAFIFSGDQFYNSTRVGGPTVPIITDIRTDDQNAYVSWGSWHAGGTCHFAFADGSVRGIDGSIDTETLGNLCNRQDSTIIAELP
jgi:prepilin-type processing-associated H-X9-DG protein